MRTAPEIVRAAHNARILLEVCGPDRIDTFAIHRQMDPELAHDFEHNLTNVLALLLGVYYDERVNWWMH